MSAKRSFVVVYPGARLHYAVPALLWRAGMLSHFYTDILADDIPFPDLISRVTLGARPAGLTRLLGRRLPGGLPSTMVTTVPVHSLVQWVAERILGRAPTGWNMVEVRLRRMIQRDGFHGADGLYTLSNADLPLVELAKQAGLFVAHEQIINPHVGLVLRDERDRFPGIESQDSEEEVLEGIRRDVAQWKLADLVIAPSAFVADEIAEHGIPAGKIAVLPYGIDAGWFTGEARPRPGRILFVGTVGLRKGSHYLASAARRLRERGIRHEVRVVGPYDPRAIERPEFAGPTYVGQVPRALVRAEFTAGSVFVLPTLAEGSSLVHLEAMACGVPVITTPNCGSVVRDGVDGFIVPIRDAEALADRIETLLTNGDLRARMSANARERAREFTWARYAADLVEVLNR